MIEIGLPTRLVGGTITEIPLGSSTIGTDTPLSGLVFGAIHKRFILTVVLNAILFSAVPAYGTVNKYNTSF